MEKKICYLCGKEGRQKYLLLDEIIDCQNCVKRTYRVTDAAKRYLYEREDGKQLLNDEAKEKLIEWVKNQPKNATPSLTLERIEEVTGVRSENTIYQ